MSPRLAEIIPGDAETRQIDPSDTGQYADMVVKGNNIRLEQFTAEAPLVKVQGNNLVANGFKSAGTVFLMGNGAVLSDCEIAGGVVIYGNDNLLSGCQVTGTVTDLGHGNRVQ